MGYRFRLHRKDLPGKPDIVLPKYEAVIFVNGCFWHHHPGCPKSKLPSTHLTFWRRKIDANMARDARNRADLERTGWRVLTVWQCETRDAVSLASRLRSFLVGRRPGARTGARRGAGGGR